MSEPPNYYHVLGLSPPVTSDQVRASYVRLLKQHHPDRVRPGPRSRQLQHLQRAYQTLRDAERRADHDRMLLEREREHRVDMQRARRRLRRLDHPPPRQRRQRMPWRGRLLLIAAGGLLLVISYLTMTLGDRHFAP
ncbi:J domain-containing protein [Sphingomonas sp.]|jgi:curved DNA-binding protein CbpA|uniref:J domain-containing protein n=1 Tax=Sphingomonas sp. TaxID=28214 RepID=UPI002D80B45B|nr:J domain-containing protein [Sphingomonas sp.]HEU0044516.1 J domain-containing protein [Sphingomonas sp.]